MEYCGIELANLKGRHLKKIKVCEGRDYLSSIRYKELIEKNKHLPFFEEIEEYKPEFQGVIIRWLYRGLPLSDTLIKVDGIIKDSKRIKTKKWASNYWRKQK